MAGLDTYSYRESPNPSYLFMVAIGPVQQFIAAGRRSRDLWFGSWLLSELSRAAALSIAERCGIDRLIFPSPQSVEALSADDLNVANKIVAQVDGDMASLGAEVELAVRRRLSQVRAQAFERIRGDFDRELAERQVGDLLELFWVATPVESGAYVRARNQLEALMAARKATRDFAPSLGSAQPKSSVDGLRESVIPEAKYPGGADPVERRREKVDQLFRQYGAGQAERLSGVDLLKRHGNRGEQSSFPSTSHLAAQSLVSRFGRLDQVAAAKARQAWDEYVAVLDRLGVARVSLPKRFPELPTIGRHDGGLIFEERLADDLEGEQLRQAQQSLRGFLAAAAGSLRPSPYFALLHADGDSMGEAIESQTSIEDHQRLSRALAGFAGAVRAIVEEKHQGALVYVGGDDVLAFLPLHTALACSRTLSEEFRQRLSGFESKGGNSPTLSVGLAISHHLEPLADVLELARAAEHQAKLVPGKNALAITLSKRSGSDLTVKGTWSDDTGSLDRRLRRMVYHYQRDGLPDGVAYELRDLAIRLGVPRDDPRHAALQAATRREAIRILGRKRAGHGTRAIDEPTLQDVRGLMADMGGSDDAISRFAEELIVARVFAEAATLAGEQGGPNGAGLGS